MKVLIVGVGSIARKHVAALRLIDPGVVIFALRSSADADEVEGIHNIFTLSELDSVTLDFAIVSNPTAEHCRTIGMLLPLGCPLFIEKPLSHTPEIGTLLPCIEEAGVLTYVACNLRFLECIRFVKQELSGLRVNEVNAYCGSYLPEWRPGADYMKVYSVRPEAGGGVHLDLIHELDYLYWLFGKPAEVHRILRNQSSLGIEACDYANYCLEYECFCANVILNYYRRDAKRTLELVCNDATWEVDLLKNRVMRNGTVVFSSEKRILDTYPAQMSYFVDLVKERSTASLNSFGEAFEVLKICLE